MWTILAILAVSNLLTLAAMVRIFWWVKVTAYLEKPVRFGSTRGLQDCWRILNSKVK